MVTFPLLLTIGHRIAGSGWDLISRQTVWAACTTAFFSSARLGELLLYRAHAHDPSANLLWRDVLFHSPTSVLIQLKSPKSVAPTGKFLDLFMFSGYHCCPVLALKALWRLHSEAGLACLDAPVFRFRSGRNLTPAHLNELLAALLTDICSPGVNTITCHSFRAGIPSILSLFPDLVSEDDIKGWGRWRSDSYRRYCRLQLGQKRAIFEKISVAVTRSLAV